MSKTRSGARLGFRTFSSSAGFTLPERFRGTFLEKWSKYWKSLYADYRSMVVDLVTETQQKPRRALLVLGALGAATQLARHNPTESEYHEQLIDCRNHALLLAEGTRRRSTEQHLQRVQECINREALRCVRLGVLSLMWDARAGAACCLYRDMCPHLQPVLLAPLHPQRLLDVGLMGRWWNIYRKFQDFDVPD